MDSESDIRDGNWKTVILAEWCSECPMCGDLICPVCNIHFSDCDCPGITQDDIYDYEEYKGVLFARQKGGVISE